jgi:hypothetical protein
LLQDYDDAEISEFAQRAEKALNDPPDEDADALADI